MPEKQGVYKITNNEGMICFVDTKTPGKTTYGANWADVCESSLNGKILRGEIVKYQYRTHEGKPINNKPTGFAIKINENIEAFLPFSLCSRFREANLNYTGETVAVMVDSFDPNSLSIIAKEITITDQNLDIELANEAVDLIGRAYEDGKYIRGTIVAEKKKWAENVCDRKRAGYLVTINGIEAFLPGALSYFSYTSDISHLIGTNIMAGVEEINVEKMTITLSMKSPYENLIKSKPIPQIDDVTTGLVTRVTPDNVCVLLPQNVMGIIPRYMYPGIEYNDLLKTTGSMIECIPFQVKRWDERNGYFCMLVGFKPKRND